MARGITPLEVAPGAAVPAVSPVLERVAGLAPWQEAMLPRLRAVLGEGPDADTAIRLLARGAPTTLASYDSKWARFQEYCDAHGRSCLPAEPSTCALYVAHIANKGTVRASSLQPYLSAINWVHKDIMLTADGPATGPLLTRLRQGLAIEQAQEPAVAANVRVALPADVAWRALQKGLSMHTVKTLEHARVLRACTAVALGFLTMGRADTTVHLRPGDIFWDKNMLYITLQHEKGRSRRADFAARTVTFPVNPTNLPLLHLLHAWHKFRDSWGHGNVYFGLKGERAPTSPSAALSAWLILVCQLLDVHPPPGCTWSSHSLRKGGASAANAIGVPTAQIRLIGGWQRQSAVVLDYIDAAVLQSPGAWFFFGAFAPGTPPRI